MYRNKDSRAYKRKLKTRNTAITPLQSPKQKLRGKISADIRNRSMASSGFIYFSRIEDFEHTELRWGALEGFHQS